MNKGDLDNALLHLAALLEVGGKTERYSLVVCGGSALLACELVSRVTKDVDVVALRDDTGELVSPAPLPEAIINAAARASKDLSLPADWLNNGPSSGPGGLFQVGLPDQIVSRFLTVDYGPCLAVHYVGRLDQICFKLYAAVDQMGSYHGQDLIALNPNVEELGFAIKWVKTQDSSEGFLQMLRLYLTSIAHADAVRYI